MKVDRKSLRRLERYLREWRIHFLLLDKSPETASIKIYSSESLIASSIISADAITKRLDIGVYLRPDIFLKPEQASYYLTYFFIRQYFLINI